MNKLFAIVLFLAVSLPSSASALFVGPYSGTVMDSQTGEPINGASVLFYWTKRIPNFEGGHSETLASTLIYIDSKGRYNVPKAFYNLGLMAFFDSTNIIIYQPGYQAYIKQIQKDDPYQKPDPSYKETENMVKLDRIPPNFNHGEHYEKIGHALWGLDSVPYPDEHGPKVSWDTFVDRNLKSGFLEKEELLRRVEWEERRYREDLDK